LKWLKAEGDAVKADEPLFEISTDKVDTEVPSPVAGTVTKLLVAEGATVPVGTRSGDRRRSAARRQRRFGAAAIPWRPRPRRLRRRRPPPLHRLRDRAAGSAAGARAADRRDARRGPRSRSCPRRGGWPRSVDRSGHRRRHGRGGRITKADVLAASPGAPAAGGATVTPMPSVGPSAAAVVVTPPSMPAGQGEDAQPISHIRKAIATHMLASTQQTARAWTTVEVNVDRLVRLREDTKEKFQANYGVKLTYLPMVTRATVDALQQFPPELAARRREHRHPRFVNMGIAVSYDAGSSCGREGADGMNTIGIARAIADLAARARSHQLQPTKCRRDLHDHEPGPYGSLLSVPIINQPNAGSCRSTRSRSGPSSSRTTRSRCAPGLHLDVVDHRLIDGELATVPRTREHNLETWDFAEDLGL
jgi:2-oxoglutarate dehydrogenase E2 component (dihydrolipoamide succinyltransferase)